MHNRFLLSVTLMFAMAAPSLSVAYEKDQRKEHCFKPKYRQFSLPVYSADNKQEVAPESEFSFIVSHVIDLDSFRLTAKGKDLPYTLEDRNSFYVVKSKLPSELTGKFVRIDSRAEAILGCYNSEGWLVKVASGVAPDTADELLSNDADTVSGAEDGVEPERSE
ncbi:MAG: hypothetical protein RQ715_10170 [Methylococcales bacterium]|nr:hypothetical protein [Methylococcales bacterium]